MRKTKTTHQRQEGYLMEIPLLMGAIAILLAIALPRLPVMLGKALVVVCALVWIGGIFYMLVLPGWQPGAAERLKNPWNTLVFAGIAVAICIAALAFILH